MQASAHVQHRTIEFSTVSGFKGDMQRQSPTNPMHDDILLVASERDRDAFKRVFDHFAPRVNAYLLKLGANREMAEDLVQDVFILVWRRAHQFDETKAALSTWIYTIARNRWIDVIRREKRPALDADDPTLVGGDAPRGDDFVESQQATEQVRLAIETLPREQAEMLRIFYFEDKSHTAIAEELGLPLGTVKSRLRLALNKLKGHFSGMEL